MRKIVIVLIFILIALYFPFKTKIDDFVKKNIFYNYIKYDNNKYFVNNDYGNFNYYNELIVYTQENLIDIFYTFINRGTEEFSFYCSPSYFGCKQDIINLINEQDELLYINDFVHTFNMFDTIKMDIKGEKVHFNIQKNYLLIYKILSVFVYERQIFLYIENIGSMSTACGIFLLS